MADERDDQTTAVHQTQPDGGATRADVYYSRDEAQRQDDAPTPPPPRIESGSATSPAEADRIASDQEDPFEEKPHLYALGAFAGAFVFAKILKSLTGGDDDD
jgi:hypothetical protein